MSVNPGPGLAMPANSTAVGAPRTQRSGPSILIFGRDPRLLETRRLILERCGYVVWTAGELATATLILAREDIRLLILCHTIAKEDCGLALALAHRALATQCLVLTAGRTGCVSDRSNQAPDQRPDLSLDAREGPLQLIAAVQESMGHTAIGTPHPIY